MFNIIIKTAVLYIVVVVVMRLMGKKQAGQLQPYEFVITLMISEVVSTPMDSPGTPLAYGLVPAITLMLFYYFFNFLCLKSKRLRTLFSGKPSILIHNGKLLSKEIRRMGYSLNDLTEQLRISGYTNISEIQYAILETNGQLSVLPYPAFSPLTPNDMDMEVASDALCASLILDVKLYIDGLEDMGLTKQALAKIVHTLGFRSVRDIFMLTVSDTGEAFIQDQSGNTKNVTLPLKLFGNKN